MDGSTIAHRPVYVQKHAHTVRAGRLFGGAQKQADASEVMEVGDLSLAARSISDLASSVSRMDHELAH
jgi:hypothetical protein